MEELPILLATSLSTVVPLVWRMVRTALQLRRLNKVAVDTTGTKVTISGGRDHNVVLDVTNAADAKEIEGYLDRYDR
ncbi:hypothetical protein [Embleya sp. NPDC005575]|uniref:hypothetical protein n=1 Tax=Embleya sp. NPDC005575 TaxID=3156892 RepID=UPI0033BD0F31